VTHAGRAALRTTRRGITTIWLVLLALGLLASAPAVSAQQASAPLIRAEVNRTSLTTDDFLTLSVTVRSGSGGTISQPIVPVLDDFRLLGSSITSSTSIINGIVSSEVIYLYQLQPTRTGTLEIPAFTIDVNGQTHSTDPIQIQVTQGATGALQLPAAPTVTPAPDVQTAAQGPGDPIFVEAVVDNDTPYVGQQVLYNFRLYQAVMLTGQPSYQSPDFTGFWNNQQSMQAEYAETINGQRYRVIELTNILFPTTSGTLTIDPARLTLPATFTRPAIVLETEPITLNVRPLPPNAPPDFEGAVGQYTISVRTNTSTVDSRNDSVILQVTISGAGNIDLLPNPAFPDTPDWRVYDTTGESKAQFANGVYRGSRTIEYVLVPTREGQVTVPPIRFSYFDPNAEEYRTIETNPIEILVAPGAAQAPVAAATPIPSPTPEATPEPEPALAAGAETTGLRPLKLAGDGPQTIGAALVGQPAFWALWAAPVVAFLGNLLIRRRERYLLANEASLRSRRALGKARKMLAQARRRHDDSHDAAARALTAYLSDKTGQPVGGMTRAMLCRMLAAQGISPDLIERVEWCMAASEAGRFGPVRDASAGRSVLNETERLLKQLEQEFNT